MTLSSQVTGKAIDNKSDQVLLATLALALSPCPVLHVT